MIEETSDEHAIRNYRKIRKHASENPLTKEHKIIQDAQVILGLVNDKLAKIAEISQRVDVQQQLIDVIQDDIRIIKNRLDHHLFLTRED